MPARTSALILLAATTAAVGQQPFPDPPVVVPPPSDVPILKAVSNSAVEPPPGPAAKPLAEVPPPPPGGPLTAAETFGKPGFAVGQQHTLGVQVQFGRPTGLRVQYALFHGGDFSILAEVFGGARAAFWGDESVVGVGGRALFTLASDGTKNALVVGPGLGVSHWQSNDRSFAVYEPWTGRTLVYNGQTGRTFLNLDVNVGWLHELSPALGWEVGLNAGVRVGLSGEESGGATVSGKVSGGTVGVYTGLRY